MRSNELNDLRTQCIGLTSARQLTRTGYSPTPTNEALSSHTEKIGRVGLGRLRVVNVASASFILLGLTGCSSIDSPPDPNFTLSSIVLGSNSACGLTTKHELYCWGGGVDGQLGIGSSPRDSTRPVAVKGLGPHVASVVANESEACAVTDAGALECWGEISSVLTDDADTPTPVAGFSSGVRGVALGATRMCVLGVDGTVVCSPHPFADSLAPSDPFVLVPSLPTNVKAIAGGGLHMCALTDDGAVFCWGQAAGGQRGNPSMSDDVLTALPVTGLQSGVVSISSSDSHTCALTDGGSVLCWGDVQLMGAGADFDATPTQVPGLNVKVKSISAGNEHTCAVTVQGQAMCWGYNFFGELGNEATSEEASPPIPVHDLQTGVGQIAAGVGATCALTTQGRPLCWGVNGGGIVGDGTEIDRHVPTDVVAP